jgi:hypothetical protein
MYRSISEMPVEVGDVFFMCLAHDQALNAQEYLEQVARDKQSQLIRELERQSGRRD